MRGGAQRGLPQQQAIRAEHLKRPAAQGRGEERRDGKSSALRSVPANSSLCTMQAKPTTREQRCRQTQARRGAAAMPPAPPAKHTC